MYLLYVYHKAFSCLVHTGKTVGLVFHSNVSPCVFWPSDVQVVQRPLIFRSDGRIQNVASFTKVASDDDNTPVQSALRFFGERASLSRRFFADVDHIHKPWKRRKWSRKGGRAAGVDVERAGEPIRY